MLGSPTKPYSRRSAYSLYIIGAIIYIYIERERQRERYCIQAIVCYIYIYVYTYVCIYIYIYDSRTSGGAPCCLFD